MEGLRQSELGFSICNIERWNFEMALHLFGIFERPLQRQMQFGLAADARTFRREKRCQDGRQWKGADVLHASGRVTHALQIDIRFGIDGTLVTVECSVRFAR